MSGARTWVIGYDIASPRRLRRVARFLEKRAVRVQYSLFIGRFTPALFDEIWAGLAGLINPRADDVRAWPVPEQPWVWTYGMTLPSGVFVAGSGSGDLWSALAVADEADILEDLASGEPEGGRPSGAGFLTVE